MIPSNLNPEALEDLYLTNQTFIAHVTGILNDQNIGSGMHDDLDPDDLRLLLTACERARNKAECS